LGDIIVGERFQRVLKRFGRSLIQQIGKSYGPAIKDTVEHLSDEEKIDRFKGNPELHLIRYAIKMN